MMKRMLLISNSTNAGEEYLAYCKNNIKEFIIANPDVYVMGLREGTMLRVEGDKMRLIGSRKMRLFKQGMQPLEYDSNAELDFLLK